MFKVSKKAAGEELAPVQAPVEEPIINTPFEEPKWHWAYASDGTANKMPGRRRASYTWTTKRSAAFQLEASQRVAFYARNDHLGFEIPYDHLGVAHVYMPDFLVRLTDGTTLILETKGLMRDPENAKFEATKRWVTAVNNWGRMGKWAFHVCKNIDTLNAELEQM